MAACTTTPEKRHGALRPGLYESREGQLGREVNERFLIRHMETRVSRIEYVLPPGFHSGEQLATVRRLSFSVMEINSLKENAWAFGYVQRDNTWIRVHTEGDEG